MLLSLIDCCPVVHQSCLDQPESINHRYLSQLLKRMVPVQRTARLLNVNNALKSSPEYWYNEQHAY
jgi:hypothetical protein